MKYFRKNIQQIIVIITLLAGLCISSCQKHVNPGNWDLHWPIIDFSLTPSVPFVGDTIRFQAIEKKGSSDVISWKWEFDSSSKPNGTGSTSSLIVDKEGMYHVSLTGRDSSGQTAFISKDISVSKDTGIVIRVMIFNGKPASFTTGSYDAMADLINKYKPNLVAMREVDSVTSRSHGVNAPAYVAKKTNMVSKFGKALDYGGGGYGSSVLSSYPIIDSKSITLHAAPGHSGSNRGYAEVTVRLNNHARDTLKFAFAKLGTSSASTGDVNRLFQVHTILPSLANNDYPAILTVNFNGDIADKDLYDLLDSKFKSAYSNNPDYPKSSPFRTYDHMYYRPSENFKVLKSYTVNSPAVATFLVTVVDLKYTD